VSLKVPLALTSDKVGADTNPWLYRYRYRGFGVYSMNKIVGWPIVTRMNAVRVCWQLLSTYSRRQVP
jgi:hypothetical protein